MVTQNSKNKLKQKSLVRLGVGILIVFLLNLALARFYYRIDLTSEKRYTISDSSKKLLQDLDDYAYFKVYLEGDFPAGFKKLRNETRDMLEEFKAYSKYVEYTFINPTEGVNTEKRNQKIQELIDRGLQPTELHVNKKDGSNRMLIFPGIILSYKGYEIPIELLKTQMGVSPEKVLNNSIETLEFNLASSLLKLVNNQKPTIAFLDGHEELNGLALADILEEFSQSYRLGQVKIDGRMSSLFELNQETNTVTDKRLVDALIVVQPLTSFPEADKYVIDQFIMYSGKVFWLIDPVRANMDSLKASRQTYGIKNELNLDDQLFKYGVRLNSNLVLDLNARSIPIVTGMMGNQPQQELLPWLYFPILTPQTNHPIVRNLNSIMTEFASTIDTVEVPNIKKTVLLQSSIYTRLLNSPAIIDLALLEQQPKASDYQTPPQAISVLLEGEFTSLYANRLPPKLKENYTLPPKKDKSILTSMVVCSDGDLIKNQIHYTQNYPLPLGYDQFTGQNFGNKDFIVNTMSYLTETNNLISIRSRELKLRLLDKNKVGENAFAIQTINTLLPLLLIAFMGFVFAFLRKRKYTVK